MLYSKGNHYRWGWGEGWFNAPDPLTSHHVSVGSCANGHGSFRTECANAALDLANQFTKPILVGLSGGSDSQVVCLTLLEQKIPFTPLVLQLLDPDGNVRNQHDIDGAFEFCKKFQLTPIVETLDLRGYYLASARSLRCSTSC